MTPASSAAPRISINVAGSSDTQAVARFTRRLPVAERPPRLTGDKTKSVAVIARDRDAGIVVGQAFVIFCRDGAADVRLSVAEPYKNHRIATRLLEHAIREARRNGIRVFRAGALAADRFMLDLFAREGCTLVNESSAAPL